MASLHLANYPNAGHLTVAESADTVRQEYANAMSEKRAMRLTRTVTYAKVDPSPVFVNPAHVVTFG
jgi:hypothetical protein